MMYEKVIKRFIDIVLSWLYLRLIIAIKINDQAPAFCTQKRVRINKSFFTLNEFCSMKMSTPYDIPTHQLRNPEHYITKAGKLFCEFSFDELSQLWSIFIGKMSIVGPCTALWNQDNLTAERGKYSANEVKRGITGWAQISVLRSDSVVEGGIGEMYRTEEQR